MIDEKKLIQDRPEFLNEQQDISMQNEKGGYNKGWNDCLNRFIDIIEEQPKVGEWIPVEDRLPEDNQTVLTCKNKQISILIWKAEKRRWLEPKGDWWWSYCMVEKWQPLPYEVKENG